MRNYIPISIALIAIAIAAVIIARSCNKPGGTETIKVDTVFVKLPPDTVHSEKLVPYEVVREGKIQVVTKRDTEWIFQDIPADTAAIMEDYFAHRHYRDTIRTKYGYVVILDTVTQNKLWSRSSIFNLTYPEITKTITVNNRKLFLGLDAGFGGGLAMGGMQLTYLDRKDNMYHFRVNLMTTGQPFFGGGVDWKLSLNKK